MTGLEGEITEKHLNVYKTKRRKSEKLSSELRIMALALYIQTLIKPKQSRNETSDPLSFEILCIKIRKYLCWMVIWQD